MVLLNTGVKAKKECSNDERIKTMVESYDDNDFDKFYRDLCKILK